MYISKKYNVYKTEKRAFFMFDIYIIELYFLKSHIDPIFVRKNLICFPLDFTNTEFFGAIYFDCDGVIKFPYSKKFL